MTAAATEIPFLDVADPAFSIRSDAVRAAREASWYATTPYGIAVLRYGPVSRLIKDRRLVQGSAALARAQRRHGSVGGVVDALHPQPRRRRPRPAAAPDEPRLLVTRRGLADFSRPYAVFDESLVVRADNPASSADELAGQRIGAIAAGTNMALAETFPAVELVPFLGTEDVFGDNRWGVAVRRGDDALREALDASLDAVTADGSLRAAWERWITWLPFPLPA